MRPWLLMSCACVAIASCASAPGEVSEQGQQRQALLDAYLIAHGMAVSYARSGHASPSVVGELARLDKRARSLAINPGDDEVSVAEAVAALTAFAARQDSGLR